VLATVGLSGCRRGHALRPSRALRHGDLGDPGAECLGRWLTKHGVDHGAQLVQCPARTLTIERAAGSDCQYLVGYEVSGCTLGNGEPLPPQVVYVESHLYGEVCAPLSAAGVCFE
jgi:hypothetical protein